MVENVKKKRLFLIDGSALAYRSYFAFIRNPLFSSKGENTSAVFGFTNAVMRLVKDENPDCLAVVFDTAAPTFRHEQFPEYKATREKMPDEMRNQLPRIREVIEAMRLPILEEEGFEADDVMGTLARVAKEKGMETVLVTGDKDFMQLIDADVKVFNPRKSGSESEIIDEEKVRERFGVGPNKVIDVLGLMGDTSDNVPGVPGVGEKTAVELIQKYGSLEAVLDHADDISRKNVRENLLEHKEQALLSKRLVTIDTHVPLDVHLEDLILQERDDERLAELFKDLEFTKLLEEVTPQRAEAEVRYHTIIEETELDDLVSSLRKMGGFTIDLETTSQNPMEAAIVGISIAYAPHEAYYIPVGHSTGKNMDRSYVLNELRSLLQNPTIKKCGQNIKYDMIVLWRAGIQLEGIDFDTMVASYLLNPSGRQHNLDVLSLEHLGHKMIPITDLIGKGKNQISMADALVPRASEYACEDADMTHQLRQLFEPKLLALELDQLFRTVEMPLISVLAGMEMNGVSIDVDFLRSMSQRLDHDLNVLAEEIYSDAGEQFNINSPKQLAVILFEKLKLPIVRRTKTGPSTDVGVLEELAKEHELPKRLLEYRQMMKLKSTYVDALPQLVHGKTGRIHTSFNQTVTVTGRLSSSDPNLQNIPIRTDMGREIRKAFIPADPEHFILSADYSQIELRIMAHLSGDTTLRRSFLNDEDVHARTAALVFGVSPEQVTPDHRRQAKVVNFGIMYGMGAFGLAQQLEIRPDEARAFIDNYFERYPGVREYTFFTVAKAKELGYVTTLLNRRRYLPEINSDDRRKREFAERTAINTPIQGTAADLIKVAMIHISDAIRKNALKTKMILQVHDELVFEVPQAELETASTVIKEKMERAIALSVPIKVDIGIGRNWYEAH
jgi:DNA polymerase-1